MVVTVSVNYLAVLVATVVQMIVGGLWYSPLLFGKMWIKLSGLSQKQLEECKKKGMGKSYALMFLGALVMNYVLAHFVAYTGATTFTLGMQTGFWIWLGFLATTTMGMVLWDNKPWSLYVLNNGYHLIVLLLTGGLLAVWL
jgi:hypothetical protein